MDLNLIPSRSHINDMINIFNDVIHSPLNVSVPQTMPNPKKVSPLLYYSSNPNKSTFIQNWNRFWGADNNIQIKNLNGRILKEIVIYRN